MRHSLRNFVRPFISYPAWACLLLLGAMILSSCETPYVAPPPIPPHQNQNHNKVKDPLLPRVPSHLIAKIRTLRSPLYSSSRNVTENIILHGRQLYEGKGTCVNCHGWDGTGNGPASLMVTLPPRNFTNCGFHNVRSDGELFWVIKNGSPGTDMAPMIPVTISEEEAWKILAYIRTFCPTWGMVLKKWGPNESEVLPKK